MVTVHIHRDFKMPHNHLIFLILGDHAKVRRAEVLAQLNQTPQKWLITCVIGFTCQRQTFLELVYE